MEVAKASSIVLAKLFVLLNMVRITVLGNPKGYNNREQRQYKAN
jgi:hypothetical protein